MPRPCIVCCRRDRAEIEALFTVGVSDHAISRRYGLERSGVSRHRREHVLKPLADQAALLARDFDARQKRTELAAAAASGAPSTAALVDATLGLRRQVEKLTVIEQRLARMADAAEKSGSLTSVAVLSAQQFKGIETGAKLAQVGGFKPPTAIQPGYEKPVISIEMVFSQSGTSEMIKMAPRTVIDGDLVEPVPPGEQLPEPTPQSKLQGELNDYWSPTMRRPVRSEDDDSTPD
jgi:hypothetical protein